MILQVLSAITVLGCISCANAASLKAQDKEESFIDEEIRSWRGPISCDVKRIGYSIEKHVRTDDLEDMFFCDDGVSRHEIVGIPEELLEELNSIGHPLPLSGEDALFSDGPSGKRVDISDASVSVDEERRLQIDNYFSVSITKGIRKVLAVRVSTSSGESVTATSSSLVSSIFGSGPNDNPNLLTQINECSYSVLSIVPATEVNVTSGVLDVEIGQTASGEDATLLADAARSAARRKVDLDMYDHVLICLPSGATFTPKGAKTAVTDWTSYGELMGSESVYNDASCSSLSEQMYQMGLNLGLRNSNKEKTSRGDGTGYMGDSSKTTLQKCYNAYNSYRLGWYANRHKTTTIKRWVGYVGDGDGMVLNLVPIIQYKLSSRYHTVIAKIPLTGMSGALFLMYNEKDDFNAGTETTADKVSIVWGSYGRESVLLGSIATGDSFEWSSYNGGIQDLVIKCLSIVKTGVPNTATVTLTLKGD